MNKKVKLKNVAMVIETKLMQKHFIIIILYLKPIKKQYKQI